MTKSITSKLAVLALVAFSTMPAYAKNAAEVQADANAKADQAEATRSVAADQSLNSAEAQAAGNEKCAAKAAKEAACQNKEAAKLDAKAADLQIKADKKAIREAR